MSGLVGKNIVDTFSMRKYLKSKYYSTSNFHFTEKRQKNSCTYLSQQSFFALMIGLRHVMHMAAPRVKTFAVTIQDTANLS